VYQAVRRWTLAASSGSVSRDTTSRPYLAAHRFSLEESPRAYEMFKKKEDGCVRGVRSVTYGLTRCQATINQAWQRVLDSVARTLQTA